jgi:tryptophan 2,3-dioxygenase
MNPPTASATTPSTPATPSEPATPSVPDTLAPTLAAWTSLALALPHHHASVSAGNADADDFVAALAALPALTAAALDSLPDPDARRLALDVLMVEAFVRRHAPRIPPGPAAPVESAAQLVGTSLGIPPILSYPLYIRDNPVDFDAIRRFTPLDAEFRFIRMHRLMEDIFDGLIARLSGILDLPPAGRRPALAAAMPAIRSDFQRVNRTMAGFRSPTRMPQSDFVHGFRPYFDPRMDTATGEVLLDGPSGLQSPTYRILAMQIGYRDAIMDGWTAKIARCHDPATRAWLAEVLAARDRGRALTAVCDAILDPILGVTHGSGPELPHLHPGFRPHIPLLLDLALRRGYVVPDILATFDHFALSLGEWPAEAPVTGAPPTRQSPPTLSATDRRDLAAMVELEAMLFGFHLEHVATAAVQIGAVQGTGGTSGVEFLLIATFRRAFPRLWTSGIAEALIRAGEIG